MRNTIATISIIAFALFVTPFAGADQYETLSIDGWTIAAAQQGDAEAQYHLGRYYWDGYTEGLLKNKPTEALAAEAQAAETQFRKAAEQGHAEAELNLGRIYTYGWPGLPQIDYHEALKWKRRAAEKGHPMSQADLGWMYENGQGVPQDYLLAHMWYNLGAAGYPADEVSPVGGVACCRAAIVKLRDALSTKMTPDQIAEAQRMAREWLGQHPAERQQ